MNWEAIAAIGEMVGAIAVVVSVIYLAVQIRENTRSSMLNVVNSTINDFSDLERLIASTPDLAQIVLRGNESLSNLTPEARMRFESVTGIFFNLMESWLSNCRRAGMEDEQVDVSNAILRNRLKNPGVREWWELNRCEYPVSYAKWVDSVAAEL